MKLKKAVELVKKNSPYCLRGDKTVPKKRQKNSKKFHDKYGFNYEDCWGLDHAIACFVLPRLVHFKKVKQSYPSGITYEEWDEILDKMIYAFKEIVKENANFMIGENRKRVEEGIELFAKYFFSLWD